MAPRRPPPSPVTAQRWEDRSDAPVVIRRWPGPLGLSLVLAAGLLLAACSSSGATSSSPPPAQAWVANYAYQSQPGSTVTPINLRTGTAGPPVSTASEPASASAPTAFAVTPDGRELLVANEGSDRLSVISGTSDAEIASVRVGLEPDAVAVARGGPHDAGIALVANFGDDSVTPVHLGTMRAGPPIAVGSEPDAIAVAGRTLGTAFVAGLGDDSLTAIDLATLVAGRPFPVGVDPTSLAVAPGGSVVWIGGGSSIEPLTVANLALGKPFAFPSPVEALTLSASGTTAWVALEDGAVQSAKLSTGTPGPAIRVGGRPSAIAITR